MGSFMEGIESILGNLSLQTGVPFTFEATQVDGLFKYLATIDWSEPWLIGLVGFHVLVFFMAIFTRKLQNVHICLFLFLLGLCFFSEKINELGAKNWRLFAREQYFDANGLFISVVFSGPIIINECIIIGLWLYECYRLLIEVVKMRKMRAKKAAQKAADEQKSDSKPENKKDK